MRPRSFTLLEAIIGLALLAALGTWSLRIHAGAIREYHQSKVRAQMVENVEQLLWTWNITGTPVSLPANGRLDERFSWRREAGPVRIAPDVMALRISVIMSKAEPDQQPADVYRVDWLVPDRRDSRDRKSGSQP